MRERIGHARAFQMALLGERVEAEQALEWGMVNQVVDDDQLDAAVAELAARFVAGPPGSYATIKRTINARAYDDFAELLELEAVLQQERAESKDFVEGVTAFVAKAPRALHRRVAARWRSGSARRHRPTSRRSTA